MREGWNLSELDEKWVDVAICLGVGMTQKETANHVGIGDKTVWNWTKDDVLGPKIEGLRKRIDASLNLSRRNLQVKASEIATRKVESIQDELEGLKAIAVDAFQRAITSPDEKTALAAFKEYMDRTEGKAVQRNINENRVSGVVDHVHHLPEHFVEGMLADAERLQLVAAPEAIEAEVVEAE